MKTTRSEAIEEWYAKETRQSQDDRARQNLHFLFALCTPIYCYILLALWHLIKETL